MKQTYREKNNKTKHGLLTILTVSISLLLDSLGEKKYLYIISAKRERRVITMGSKTSKGK